MVLVVRALPVVLWLAYVFFSRRIAITVRKRVHVDDPFLRAQWMADRPTGLRPTGTRGTIYARPYRAAPVEHPSQEDAPPAPVIEAATASPDSASPDTASAAPVLTPQPGRPVYPPVTPTTTVRSEEHTSELQSPMRTSLAGICL